MKIAAVADTHTVIWYVCASPMLSEKARTFMDNLATNGLYVGVSAISLAEMVYLAEKGRITEEVYKRLTQALDDPYNVLTELHFTSEIVKAMRLVPRKDVPDFPDRIIAATAKRFDIPLITKDSKIRAANVKCVW